MKKYLLIAVMALVSLSTFASIERIDVEKNIKKYEMKINQEKLARTLQMDAEQLKVSEDVLKAFEENMAYASMITNEQRSNKFVSMAVKSNLRQMYFILKNEQYKKYRAIMNETLRNRGFDLTEICKY